MTRGLGTWGVGGFLLLLLPSSGWGQIPSAESLPDTLVLGPFEALPSSDTTPLDSLLPDWIPLEFGGDRGRTSYGPESVGGRSCLLAEASGGGSGLLRLLGAEENAPGRVRWSWWVEGPVAGGDVTRKEGDDFAARVYVNFRFEPGRAGIMHRLRQRLAGRRFGGEAPGKALVYVWGNLAAAGIMIPNAYTDQAVVVVVRTGAEEAGQWWTEERDVTADFLEAFGHDPPPLHSVAIMTDADDTGSSARACYGDVVLIRGP